MFRSESVRDDDDSKMNELPSDECDVTTSSRAPVNDMWTVDAVVVYWKRF